MTKGKYIKKVNDDKLFEELKRQIVFGLILGLILLFISLVNILFVKEANRIIWKTIAILGGLLFIIALVIPQALYYIEKIWSSLAKLIGKVIFSVILSLTYFLLFLPLGLLYQRSKEASFFSYWNDVKDLKSYGWSEKVVSVKVGHNKKRNMLLQFYDVLRFFIENKQWWLIPLIIFLLIIGLILFFVQTSVLAPFIYTLF